MKALLLLLTLAAPAFGQQAEQVFPLPLFRDGLYTRYSPNAIPDGALSEALNVLIDQDVDGVVVSRNGYTKYNTSALTDSKTVRGLWSFDASDGTKYMVAFSSQTFFKTAGDGVWTAITGLNNFSLTKDFDCVQTLGALYCANGDTVFSWNGTSTNTISGAPSGNIVGRFRNRLLMAGISGAKARLRGSGELDTSDWTLQVPGVSTTPFSIPFGGVDDGQDITCLMGAFQDVFIVGKRNSLWGLYGFGRNDFQVRELSREVGCLEPRSVREKNNCLYWMSLRGIEKFCGASVERIGDPIRDKIDTIVAVAGNARSALDSTQSDFQQGNLTASGAGAPMSATISPENVVASTWSGVDTTAANWLAGTIVGLSTYTIADTLTAGSSSFADTFSDFNYTAAPVWTANDGNWSAASGALVRGSIASGSIHSTNTVAYGSWSWSMTIPNTAGYGAQVFFICSDFAEGTCGGADGYWLYVNQSAGTTANVRLFRQLGSTPYTATEIAACTTTTTIGLAQTYRIVRTIAGVFSIFIDGSLVSSCTDATYTTSGIIEVSATNSLISYDNFDFIGYNNGGSLVSRIFDTGLSTPTYGSFVVNMSSSSEAPITFTVQSSIDGVSFESPVAQTPGAKIGAAQRRYIKYNATFTNNVATKTFTVSDVTLTAATTGYFISQCRNPSTAITSWGLFNCTQNLNDGNLTYYISTGTTCNSVTRTTATWNTQSNNAPIALTTAAYVAYRVLFTVDSGTETPTVNDCTINWSEGETRPPVASQVYRDRYYLAYTSSTASGSVNDHMLVLDKNDKWTLFDNHHCYSLANYNRKLYCGSSTNAGQIWLLDFGTDDDGTAILAKMRSKAFNFGMPERRKEYRRLYLDLEPSPDPAQTITLTGRYTLERSTPTYSLGNIDLNEDPGSILTPRVPFPVENPTSGRYLQLELESSGLNSPWRLFGGRLYFSPLEPE